MALSLFRVAFRVPAHVFAALAQAFDYVEDDIRRHVLAEPTLPDSLRDGVMREAADIRRSGNDHAPVDVNRIN